MGWVLLNTDTTERTLPRKRQRDLASALVAVYLGLAPVYWLPSVSPMLVRGAKGMLLVSSLIVWFMGRRPGGLLLPRGLLGPAGFMGLAFLAIPGMYQAGQLSLGIEFLVDVALSALFVWLLFSMQMKGHDTFPVFVAGMTVISVFAALPVASALIGVPRFQSPFDLAPFTSTGFGAGRTGWANALSLYVPVALAALLTDKRRARTALASLVIIVMAQVVSGGRTGLLLTFFSTAGIVLMCGSKKLKAVVLTIVLMGTLLVVTSAALRGFAAIVAVDQLRLGNLRGRATFELLDALTSYRLRGYVTALELIGERPLVGHGLGSILIYVAPLGTHVEIHNLWLKLAVYCGVLLPLFLLIVVGTVVIVSVRAARTIPHRGDRVVATAYLFLLVNGIAITMVEPASLVGAFQNSALWWGVTGSVLASHATSSPGGSRGSKRSGPMPRQVSPYHR